MHAMSSKQLHDFIQVIISMRKHHIKVDYFSKLILFTTIYLFHKQKLNHGNYSEQELNMGNFVQNNEYDVHMYTKF
jgi:hypothetical protein